MQAMARNRIPTIKKAVNAAFKNFDALIMPSAKYVAKKLQASNTTVTGEFSLITSVLILESFFLKVKALMVSPLCLILGQILLCELRRNHIPHQNTAHLIYLLLALFCVIRSIQETDLILETLQESTLTSDNVRLANVCGIPALSLNVGSCLPEPCDVSITLVL